MFWLLNRCIFYFENHRTLPNPEGYIGNPRDIRAVVGAVIFTFYSYRVYQIFPSIAMSNLEKGQSSGAVTSDSDDEALVFRRRRVPRAPRTNRVEGGNGAPSTSGRPEGGEVVVPAGARTEGGQEGREGRIVPMFDRSVEVRRRHLGHPDEPRFKAEGVESTITEDRISEIIAEFQFPSDVRYRVPGKDDYACSPRSGEIAVYEAALFGGLRFPLPRFVRAVLTHLDLAVGQIVPNSWRILIGAAVFWAAATGESMKPSEFFHCYKVTERESGWWYFSARKPEFNFVVNMPSSHKGWKDKFFFIRGSTWEFQSWETEAQKQMRVPQIWGQPTLRGMS